MTLKDNNLRRILVTGSAGFIAGYLVKELLDNGYRVRGVDNFSKYGHVAREYDSHPAYEFVAGDCKDASLMCELVDGCEQVIAGAALIGGISYFHSFPYDLIAENERILASTFDAAIGAHKKQSLRRIVVISSSMVFESTNIFPTPEGAELTSPPPHSTYGFQKLAAEYFARGANQQYGLPYTIVRPFNCVGTGEGKALVDKEILSGNIKLAMSHVLPDLAQKVLKGQRPLHILGNGDQIRHYTHGKDLARGIRLAMESHAAVCEDFNVSTDVSTSVIELARLVWRASGVSSPFDYICDEPFVHDVQRRVPNTTKARKVLGFKAEISVEQSVCEVVEWVRGEIAQGRL
jgi:nucleoside-diphosphate-sugar epimerase